MSVIIRDAFRALEDIVDVKMEPIRRKTLKEAITDSGETKSLEDQTIKDLFIEAGAYVLTKEFKKDGMTYFLFVEGTSNGEAADLLFDEFDIDNIDGFLLEILDEERNFVDDITLKDLKSIFEKEKQSKTETLKEEEGEEETTEIPYLEAPVVKVIEVAKEHIDSTSEQAQTAEPAQEELKEEKPEPKEETMQLTGFNEAVGNTKFFPGEDGDIEAARFIEDNNVVDFKIEWDEKQQGYLITWGNNIKEAKSEGRHKFKNRKIHNKKEPVTEAQHFALKDKEDLEKAKEIVTDNKKEEPVEKIVDVNAETVDDLKKSYVGSTILQCVVCRTMVYKDPKDLIKPETETAEGEKLYNVEDNCPHCGAKDGYELIGQVAALTVDTENKPEPPMTEPVEGQPTEGQPAEETTEEKPVETIGEPTEEKPSEEVADLTVVEEPAEGEKSDEEEPSEEGQPEEETKKDKKNKKTKVSIIPENIQNEPLKEQEEEKNWGVKQNVEYKVYKQRPELILGFVITGLTKSEAEAKAKEMNTESINKNGIFYRVAQVEETKAIKEKYQDVKLESFDEVKFDRLAKKYLNEVYENIESYITRRALLNDESNTVVVEGIITFKSGVTKDTKFVFEAKEITKKNKLKLVGINETFANKKAFTLISSVENNKILSESLTYSYKINEKKVYGQVKNPQKI